MNLNSRQRDILDWLHQASPLSTEALAERFAVSTQTIRRDINELSEHGLARRVHGGLSLPASQQNLSFLQRSTTRLERKQRIARAAVAQVVPGSTIFLGYGTTVAEFARALPADLAVRVVTNNLDAVQALIDKPAIETWLAGGRLRGRDRDVMGVSTLDFMRRFRAHLAICGVAGVDADGQLYEFQPEEAELSQQLLASSQCRVLLADSSKYLLDAPCHVAALERIDHFYSDADGEADWQPLCERAGVQLHLC
ncbi:DeoR/GlpR family DNA-binding transcription regulator [Chitinibacteraceae bacterium HSL-7]